MLAHLENGLVIFSAIATHSSPRHDNYVVALAEKTLFFMLAYASCISAPAFQVHSRDEVQKNAIKKLPGRHLWTLSELAIATGFGDKPSALKSRLKKLFGGEWKEGLGIASSRDPCTNSWLHKLMYQVLMSFSKRNKFILRRWRCANRIPAQEV